MSAVETKNGVVDLVRNANVTGHVEIDNKRAVLVTTIDDKYEHKFRVGHPVNKMLDVMEPKDIIAELNGGSFFFANGHLVEFRDRNYKGYIHDDQSIIKLADHIGVSDRKDLRISSNRIGRPVLSTRGQQVMSGGGIKSESNMILVGRRGTEEFDIPAYKQGGIFDSHVQFSWSPFRTYVNGVFQLVRQVCSNGMIGASDYFNSKVPLINKWEEHLDIAFRQIQTAVQTKTKVRLTEMGTERASVAALGRIHDHAILRLDEGVDLSKDEIQTLHRISMISDAEYHLHNHYHGSVFEDKNISAQVPGHLTAFDAWNLVTEMLSHTPESTKSTTEALSRIANHFVFNEESTKVRLVEHKPNISAFSDPTTAFFGKIAM